MHKKEELASLTQNKIPYLSMLLVIILIFMLMLVDNYFCLD
ncbi:hypothetical protein PLUTE_b1019 [Pseudoalteromonas luteoviolacea DSM 6061]|nr:hypothetical protein [Pseudoalteromonas luteoviolacea DSM 6061]